MSFHENLEAGALQRSPESPRRVLVLGLCGSIKPSSFTRLTLAAALAGAKDAGADVQSIDLCDYDLPFCSGNSKSWMPPPDVLRLREQVRAAQGFILATPEYHSSFSGVLKNAIDLTDMADWQGKLIGLVGVSGGKAGPAGALAGLRAVGRGLGAWVLPQQAGVAEAYRAFDEQGEFRDPKLAAEVRAIGEQVTRQAARIVGQH